MSKCLRFPVKSDRLHQTMIPNFNQYSTQTYIPPSLKFVYPEYRITISFSVTVIGIKRYTESDVDCVFKTVDHSLIENTHRI